MTELEAYEHTALIEPTLAGHTDCFAVLMNRHAASVKRYIGPFLRNSDENDDVIQEVMLKTWRHLSSFRGECSFRSWMIRVATNESLMFYRKRRTRPPLCHNEIDIPAPEQDSPHRAAVRRETYAVRRQDPAISGASHAFGDAAFGTNLLPAPAQ